MIGKFSGPRRTCNSSGERGPIHVPSRREVRLPRHPPGPDLLRQPENRFESDPPVPKRTDIQKILIVGAGPIVIGQACEFDYSGTQACKALREEGYKVVLVNSNPATIMTDPEMADRTYIEPITAETVEQILAVEKPDAVLPTLGGQTGLNVGMALHESAPSPAMAAF